MAKQAQTTLDFKFHPRQIDAFTSQATEILYGGAAGGGKALAENEQIYTLTSGWKTMGTIVVGDSVLGGDGKPTSVVAATETMYGHECYRIGFLGGHSVVADAGHLWRVDGPSCVPAILTTNDMSMMAKSPQGLPTLHVNGPSRRHDIVSIEPVDSVPVRCIQVEAEDGMFLVGREMIPTHNSHLMRVSAISSCLEVPGLQVYLLRRQSTDLIKNHVEGPSGFPILLSPLVKADYVKIVYSPSCEITFRNGPSGGYEGGSKIFLCHCKDENNKFSFQGAEIHYLLLDELGHFTETIYTFLRSRVRLAGLTIPPHVPSTKYPRILCGSNPGGVGHGWVKAAFIDGVEPMEVREMPDEEGGLLRQYIPARLSDNPTLLENDPKYASRLRGLGNDALVKAMLEGDWNVFVGQAFHFTAKHHVIAPRLVPPHAPIFMCFDWGHGAPFSVGWFWVDSDGRVFMFSEWYGWTGKPNEGLRMPDTEIAQGILEREERLGIKGRDIQRLSGPDCFSKKPDYRGGGQGPSTADVFAQYGLFLRSGDPDKRAKLRQFYERLRVPADGTPPMFQVYENCRQFIRTVPTLTMRESDPEMLEDHGAEDHCYEMACHVCMARPIDMTQPSDMKTFEAKLIEAFETTGPATDTQLVEGYYGEDLPQTSIDQMFSGGQPWNMEW